jgi:tRNA A-37 threonylcarbamoyl transferase component Bud32
LAPSWAQCPFPVSNQIVTDDRVNEHRGKEAPGAPTDGTSVLIGNRFLIRAAIRHANKGGVYRAVDTASGADVVIKEARPHVGTDLTGKDVRDLLRAEARALELVRPVGVAPRLLELFEQAGHLFLAEELVPGVSLYQWVAEGLRNGAWSRGVPEALDMAGRLVELMDVAHQAGLIIGDFNPNNIMVRPDGGLSIVDLELAVQVGEQSEESCRAATPGFSAPEQMDGVRPTIEADLFSLGATICFVVTEAVPLFLADLPKTRSLQERLREWLAVRSELIGLSHHIQTPILGLMHDEPDRRWTVSAARSALAVAQQAPQRAPRAHRALGSSIDHPSARLDNRQFDEGIEGCVGHLLATMSPADVEQLWPASCAYGAFDPCTVQLGAAGVVGVLTRYFELTNDRRLPAAIATAGSWIARRMDADVKRSGALYFGGGGIAWSLYEAGRAVGDDRLVQHGLALADRLNASSDYYDVTHGTAGIGLTFLHFWLRTGNENFAHRASGAADALNASAREKSSGLTWTTPPLVDSRLAGGSYFGFAHGTAGIGYFLLATALATGRSDCLDFATRAGETLLANASVGESAALWGASPGDDVTASYWCHGSAGIGSFLARMHRVTGDDRYAKMANLSAQAVMDNAGRAVLGQCHGLAGNGDFLLDIAASADGQPYEAMAYELARVIFSCRAYRDGRVVFPDEHGDLSVSWAHGLSGILAFFLRLRHRSSRLWMVDSLLERSLR